MGPGIRRRLPLPRGPAQPPGTRPRSMGAGAPGGERCPAAGIGSRPRGSWSPVRTGPGIRSGPGEPSLWGGQGAAAPGPPPEGRSPGRRPERRLVPDAGSRTASTPVRPRGCPGCEAKRRAAEGKRGPSGPGAPQGERGPYEGSRAAERTAAAQRGRRKQPRARGPQRGGAGSDSAPLPAKQGSARGPGACAADQQQGPMPGRDQGAPARVRPRSRGGHPGVNLGGRGPTSRLPGTPRARVARVQPTAARAARHWLWIDCPRAVRNQPARGGYEAMSCAAGARPDADGLRP